MLQIFITTAFLIGFVHGMPRQNNVCDNLSEYVRIWNNPHCWYNPDVDSSVAVIVKRHGYHLEEHKVVTQDGYILNLFRVMKEKVKNEYKQPVLFQHGIGADGAVWVLIGNQSIAFQLVDKGYDVWISNSRGSRFSTGHQKYTIRDRAYWDFSFHEMGIYDLPAQLEFIAKTSKNPESKIILIGHSMGSTMSLIYGSLRKQHSVQRLKAIVLVAPVAYMKNVRAIFKLIAPFGDQIEQLLTNLGLNPIIQDPELQQNFMKLSCGAPALIKSCELMHWAISGLSADQLAPENFPIFFNNFLVGMSLKTLKHYGQIMFNNGRFQWYDYGPNQNLQLYNSTVPPEYDVTQISLPVHIFMGKNDFLSDPKDVDFLYGKLKNGGKTKRMVSRNDDTCHFAHNDFLMGKHIDIFHEQLFPIIDKYQLSKN